MSSIRWCLACGLAALLAGCVTVSEATRSQAETRRQLAQVRLGKNQVEMSIVEYLKSIELYDKDPEAHFGLSEAYRRKGYFDLAERELFKTLRVDPTFLDARLNLGVIYLQQERWQEAIQQNDILVLEPAFLRPARALVNRGWAHYKSGNTEQAERDFRRALKEGGANHFAHMNLGILYYGQGELVTAIQEFDQVLEILELRPVELFGASEAEARFRIAQAYVRLGQRVEAIEHLDVALERGGKGKWGRKSKDYLAVLQ